jgi:carboxyl-terminal processing protease
MFSLIKKQIFTAFIFTAFFLFSFKIVAQNNSFAVNNSKMTQFLRQIDDLYIDTVNFDKLVENGIVEILKELDPHSIYIPKKDVQQMNEPLQGSFDGIGVTFQLIKDTINITEVIVNGPSEKVGLLAGDKIIKVDSLDATGKKINNKWVQTHLRGKKGTKVVVLVKRGKNKTPLEFTIIRDKIPMNSINVAFMVDSVTGYIRLERFAQTSPREFREAIGKLKSEGLKNLIFDLRGNGGGYLDAAFKISDEFIKKDLMIVYTDNFRKTGQSFRATEVGNFENGKLIILVDEGSASASEIVSGAVQDWDRGIIMGRRTFGKGLVQKPIYLLDQSMIRLTISNYYTPTGRCIQKPYNDGLNNYFRELQNRQKHGEFLNADSISFPDSLKYTTPRGRIVYGGGGIMPDIFVPIDTSKYSSFFNEMIRKGAFGEFTMEYMEKHRDELKKKYPTFIDYKNNFNISDKMYDEFMTFVKGKGIADTVAFNFAKKVETFGRTEKKKLDSLFTTLETFERKKEQFEELLTDYLKTSYEEAIKLRNLSKVPEFTKEYLKFEIGRTLYSYGQAYEIFLLSDDTFLQAYKAIKDDSLFKKYNVDL